MHQCHICLLSPPPSFHVKQTVVKEEPFTSTIQTAAKVFCMRYVDMIVLQLILACLLAQLYKAAPRARITSIIRLSHVVLMVYQTHIVWCILNMERIIAHQLIYPRTNVKGVQELLIPHPLIQVLSLHHCCFLLLQTIMLLSTIAFGVIPEVQIMKSNIATSSGTHRLNSARMEQSSPGET